MTALASLIDPKTDVLWNDFVANAADLPGAGLDWLEARRGVAMDAFAATGNPTRYVEAWKYTDLASVLDAALEPATPFRAVPEESGALADPFAALDATRIVLVNGYLQTITGKPLSKDIDVIDLAQLSVRTPGWVKDHLGMLAAGAGQPMGAASLALMRGGAAIRISQGTKPALLHLSFLTVSRGVAQTSHMRVLIVVESGARLTLLESDLGEGEEQTFANLGIEIVLAPAAALDHVRLQAEAPTAVHVASMVASLAKDSCYRGLSVALGARLSRTDMVLHLAAPGAEAQLRHVAAIGDKTLADMTTVMDHAAPHTVSRQLFKSVLGGRARSVAQGRVTVRPGAVKSDSHQLFKALLLGARAEADTKPELEIFADDVVCGHGTAIGALDPDALFYLRARGIGEAEARGLLLRAFLDEAIDGFVEPAIHGALWRCVDAALTEISGPA